MSGLHCSKSIALPAKCHQKPQNINWHLMLNVDLIHMFRRYYFKLIWGYNLTLQSRTSLMSILTFKAHLSGGDKVILPLTYSLLPSHSGCWASEFTGIWGGGWGGPVEPGAPGLPGEPGQDELDTQRGDGGAWQPCPLHTATEPEPWHQELLGPGGARDWGHRRRDHCLSHRQRGRSGTLKDVL